MKTLKNIFHDLPLYILWAMASWFLVGFVFGRIEYTPSAKKVVLCAEVHDVDYIKLSVELEKNKPAGMRQVRAYSFDYFMFDDGTLNGADLYVVTTATLVKEAEQFAELDPAVFDPGTEFYSVEGRKIGIPVKKTGEAGIAATFIKYEDEDYYLAVKKTSKHAKFVTGNGDDAAKQVFETFMKLK